jgi:hypothetical protein
MSFLKCVKTGVAIALFTSAAANAASVEQGYAPSEPAIPQASTQKFLDNVRTYGNGQPSPTILYSTGGIAQATNSPEALKGPSVTSTGPQPEKTPLRSGTLSGGGTLERRSNQPYQITPGAVERRQVTPTPVQSQWQ